jgi:3-dehydroquinate dehydratase-2
MKILIINGPNINMLGQREEKIYGGLSYNEMIDDLTIYARNNKIDVEFYQSNSEGEIVTKIQNAKIDYLILNAAAYTHTSIAIRDALLAVKIPFIEVHISNVFSREPFRQKSYLSDIAIGVITGFGIHSYKLAMHYFKLVNESVL